MAGYVYVEVKVTTYLKIPVESNSDELAKMEAAYMLNDESIDGINVEVTRNDGTVHTDYADDWKIIDYHIDED